MKPLKIGNCSGFYGDRLSAAYEMVTGGEIDVLTGDYLAELTMFLLWKSKTAGRPGYAVTFLTQLEEVLRLCIDKGIRIVVNAGGLDPQGLAVEVRELSKRLGVTAKVAHIEGDDLVPRLSELQQQGIDLRNIDTGETLAEVEATPVTANAYLGGRGIARALGADADIVICPRVTDASLVVGPSIWHFGWREDEYDKLAGAVAAGHIIECGTQATGGNYSRFREISNLIRPGFPIAEITDDGSSIITKHEETGGEVTVGTVTAQLVYEIGDKDYLNTDVTLALDSIQLTQLGPNRVRVSNVKGTPPPPTVKTAVVCGGMYNQSMTFALTGNDIDEKAALAQDGLLDALGGKEQFDAVEFNLIRHDKPEATFNELAVAKLVATFSSYRKEVLGRRIFSAATGLALGSYPGLFFQEPRQQKPSQTGINWPCLVPQSIIDERVVLENGTEIRVSPLSSDKSDSSPSQAYRSEETKQTMIAGNFENDKVIDLPLGKVFDARSGDKGANANVGIWARTDEAHAWLRDRLTVEYFRSLFPEADGLKITRTDLPNLRAVNFVVYGLLGLGAASGTRFDTQAKGLGEFIRSRSITVPSSVLVETDKKVTV